MSSPADEAAARLAIASDWPMTAEPVPKPSVRAKGSSLMHGSRPHSAPASRKTIEPIQQLRGIAALGVVIFHSLSQINGESVISPYARLGAAGVDLFFVISGFIMWVTAAARDQSPVRFALKRLVRIVPLYWLVTTFVVVIVLLAPKLMRNATFDPAHVIASYAFVAWPHPKFDGRFWPLVIPGWTLNYEMPFYAIVTLSLLLRRNFRPWMIAAVLLGAVLLGLLLHPQSLLAFYTAPILLEFLFGIALGMLYMNGVALRQPVAWILLAAALLLFLAIGPHCTTLNRPVTWGLPMASLVLAAINLNGFAPRKLLLSLGDASYSIYLSQFCIIAPCARLLGPLTESLGVPRLPATSVLVLFTAAVVIVVYRAVERPFTEGLRQAIRSAPRMHRLHAFAVKRVSS